MSIILKYTGKLQENDYNLCRQVLFRKQGQELWHLFFVNKDIVPKMQAEQSYNLLSGSSAILLEFRSGTAKP